MMRMTEIVKALIIINVLIFIGTLNIPEYYKEMGHLYFFQSEKFMPFQIITSMFMHANFSHLAFNMMSLFFLGPIVEKTLGQKRFLNLYIIAGLVASLAHVGVHYIEYFQILSQFSPENIAMFATEGKDLLERGRNYADPTLGGQNLRYYHLMNTGALGASGAVYGVVIAFVTMFPNEKLMIIPIPVPIAAKYIGIGMVAIGVISGIGSLQPGIAHFAHLGGALTGFLLIRYWKMANLR